MPSAVRVRTSGGWQDIAIQGPPGPAIGEYELASVLGTADVTVAASAAASANTVLTLPAILFDGLTTVVVEFWTRGVITANILGANIFIGLWMDGVQVGANALALQTPAAQNLIVPAKFETRITPSAGSHTFSIRAWRSGGDGTITGGVNPGSCMFARVKKVVTTPQGNPIPVVTVLPSAPSDGQEVYYRPLAASLGYIWHLRYNSAIADAYKWEFIGGTRLVDTIASEQATSNPASTYVDLATVGPQITLPLVGIYDVQGGVDRIYNNTANVWDHIGYKLGAAATVNGGSVWNGVANYGGAMQGRVETFTVTVAGTVIKMQYTNSAGDALFRNRKLFATPVRVG